MMMKILISCCSLVELFKRQTTDPVQTFGLWLSFFPIDKPKVLFTCFSIFIFSKALSTTITLTANNNWSAITSGSGPGGLPSSADAINVKNNAILTVDVSDAVANSVGLGFGGGSSGPGTIRFNANAQLDLSGGATGTLTLGASSSYNGLLDMASGGTLITKGIGGNNSSFTPGSGTVQITGTTTLLSTLVTYNNLIINGSGITVTLGSNITCNGYLTITTGTLTTSSSNYVLTINGTTTISSGTVLNANNSTITCKSDFVNSGTFTYGASTMIFEGASAQQIQGNTATSFYNLTLDNSLGLTLAPNDGIITTVRNTLTLTNGKITLGNFELDIGATGISGSISGATSSNYIITNGTGTLNQFNIGTGQRTSAAYPIGISSSSYTPVTITVSGTTTADNYKVSVSQSVLYNGTEGSAHTSNVVDRTWNITEGTAGGSDVTITVQWNASDELTGFVRSSCLVAHYTEGSWAPTTNGDPASGSDPYTRISGNITSFSPFSVESGGILPIELLSFKALLASGQVQLNWETASESNNDHYTIERTQDASTITEIAKVKGGGNSGEARYYSFIDDTPLPNLSYYRLKQTDFDGKSWYSNWVAIHNFQAEINLFPNPAQYNQTIYLGYKGKCHEHVEIIVIDMTGQTVFSKTVILESNNFTMIPLTGTLLPGFYTVTTTYVATRETYKQKIVIE